MARKRRISKRNHTSRERRRRRLAIRAIRRNPPDADKLGRALIELARLEEAKKEQAAREQGEADETEEEDDGRGRKDRGKHRGES